MADNRAVTKVRPEEKQSAASLAFVWIGGVISAPAIMMGSLLVAGNNMTSTLIIIIIGFLIQAFLMAVNGMEASDLGYPAAVLLGKTFGEIGSRFILSGLISLLQFVQAGIQAGVCGGAFYELLVSLGVEFIPLWLCTFIWGMVMVVTAVYGFGWMKWLNYIAVPFLVVVCLYGVIKAGNAYGWDNIFAYEPENPMTFMDSMSLIIGMLAMGCLTTTNLTRFAKSRKATIGSTFLGIVPAALLMLTMGAVMALAAGTSDITVLFIQLDLPVLGTAALLLATWTTNTTNYYMTGIELVRVFKVPDKKRGLVTLISGFISTALGMLGILNFFSSFMSLLSAIFPCLAGIMIADYWIIGKGKKESFGIVPGFNWIGFVSWLGGALTGLLFKAFSPAFTSIIVGMVLYLIFYKLFKNKVPAPIDPEHFVGTGD